MEELRRSIDWEVIDYQQLMDVLREYSKPRDKISSLMATGAVVRVKKGLYVFGEAWRRQPVCRELLANLICGPSYISLQYALSHHGMIPERVNVVTSVTSGKTRRFQTPFGLFTYRRIPMMPYAMGLTQAKSGADYFLIASPEKALADIVWLDRRFKPSASIDYAVYLFDDLRIDRERLAQLDLKAVQEIAGGYNDSRIAGLVEAVQRTRRKHR